MIILISPEETSENEIATLHQLFEAGLSHFHLRKPNASLDDHIAYLNMVNATYHNRIMTHNFHKELCSQFNIMGVHLEEAMWRAQGDQLEQYVQSFTAIGNSVSSSYHEPENLASQAVRFEYTLLSPVFSAISKSDMKGRGFDVRHINKNIVGMGGINATTTPEALKLGFKGVGALGGIWNADDPVAAFIEMKNAFAKANT
ncbi:thiamine phosphate synthase [uncultured Dokdonia sp.]|uniref:thiamine phosphate synthase n=1 Tax=uncultured Dokdonia sp. TaxID=575653 RepID=UPI0026179EF2|nr:thiamine phosphate synthase [uncultured Dokdonia sp.]